MARINHRWLDSEQQHYHIEVRILRRPKIKLDLPPEMRDRDRAPIKPPAMGSQGQEYEKKMCNKQQSAQHNNKKNFLLGAWCHHTRASYQHERAAGK